MADLPITSDEGATPVVINDPITTANVATVVPAGAAGGALVTTKIDGYKATYSAAILGLVAGTAPTDIFTIYGSASKTIRVLTITFAGTQNTSAIRDVQLIKRSATNTGGTSSSVTAGAHDSNSAAATATVLAYTANPTALGATVAAIRTDKVTIAATNLVGATDRLLWNFGEGAGQAIVLRGTAQGLAINLNGVTDSSSSFNISVDWTEE